MVKLEQIIESLENERCAAVLDNEFNPLWEKGGLFSSGAFAQSLRSALDFDARARLERCGFVHLSLNCFPIPLGGLTLCRKGEYFAAVLDEADGGVYGFHADGCDRLSDAVRSAINRISVSSAIAESLCANDESECEQAFEGIRHGEYKTLRCVQNAVIYYRCATGGLILNKTTVDVRELVEALCRSAQDICKSRVEFKLSLPKSPVIACIDVTLAERAILNILLNAMTYTRESNEIQLALEDDGANVSVTVKDFGAGMKPQTLARVYEPYFSRDPADDSDYAPGLGLGIPIAAEFCRLHGGTLAISSEFAVGTTVVLSMRKGEASGELKAQIPNYVTNKFSSVYVELCDVASLPK